MWNTWRELVKEYCTLALGESTLKKRQQGKKNLWGAVLQAPRGKKTAGRRCSSAWAAILLQPLETARWSRNPRCSSHGGPCTGTGWCALKKLWRAQAGGRDKLLRTDHNPRSPSSALLEGRRWRSLEVRHEVEPGKQGHVEGDVVYVCLCFSPSKSIFNWQQNKITFPKLFCLWHVTLSVKKKKEKALSGCISENNDQLHTLTFIPILSSGPGPCLPRSWSSPQPETEVAETLPLQIWVCGRRGWCKTKNTIERFNSFCHGTPFTQVSI